MSASAGGPSAICNLNQYCINKNSVAYGYVGTAMTYGWQHYPGNATSGTIDSNLTNNSFSNGGGIVAYNIRTIRNRNNITGRMMCLVDTTPGVVDFSYSASFYSQYWVAGNGWWAFWPNSTTTCPY
jgi:hypothetical protein